MAGGVVLHMSGTYHRARNDPALVEFVPALGRSEHLRPAFVVMSAVHCKLDEIALARTVAQSTLSAGDSCDGVPMTFDAGATTLECTRAGVAGRRVAMVDAGAYRVLEAEYANSLMLPMHAHPRPALSFVTRGSYREITRRGVTVCSTGMLHVRPSEEPHANEFDPAVHASRSSTFRWISRSVTGASGDWWAG